MGRKIASPISPFAFRPRIGGTVSPRRIFFYTVAPLTAFHYWVARTVVKTTPLLCHKKAFSSFFNSVADHFKLLSLLFLLQINTRFRTFYPLRVKKSRFAHYCFITQANRLLKNKHYPVKKFCTLSSL